MSGTAVISDDGLYRYRLDRTIDGCDDDRQLAFVMLNPSTADADLDDQTIRRCKGYARRQGCGRLVVVNLFAYRTVSPDVLRQAHRDGVDVVGPDNVVYVDQAMRSSMVVVAWGNNAATCPPTPVGAMLVAWSQPLWCLGLTGAGHPRHPSRGPDRELVRWSPFAQAAAS